MKERPILFSGPMVRAILDGTKSQTRRVVKCPHKPWKGRVYDASWTVVPHSGGGWRAVQHDDQGRILPEISGKGFPCPYGVPGDRLWVRETFWDHDRGDPPPARAIAPDEDKRIEYRATPWDRGCSSGTGSDEAGSWTPSIHMPRWASRLTLTITDVRVERLQEISTHDVEAEGISIVNNHGGARNEYRDLWDSLNKARGYGWDANPWVWVLSFTPDAAGGRGEG